MINRAILEHPEWVINNFDWFNDLENTLRWLEGLDKSPQRDLAIVSLRVAEIVHVGIKQVTQVEALGVKSEWNSGYIRAMREVLDELRFSLE